MIILTLFLQNLLSPTILFFVLGCFSGIIKSDLSIPDSISRYLSLYLMMAIGFKGGVSLNLTPEINGQVVAVLLVGLGIGFLQPFIAFFFLKMTTKIDRTTAAAIAAHYGSISVVTFVTAVSFLKEQSVVYGGYIVAVLALMEAPAILSGLVIANRGLVKQEGKKKVPLKEIFTNGAILMLMGSFLIGLVTGQQGLDKMGGFLVEPFQGFLALFLLDMGLVVTRQIHQLRELTKDLFIFGLYMPFVGGLIGGGLSYLLGLESGTGMLFMVLCASASYIAVPAALKTALPEAKSAIYISLSLGITFPFNVLIGIPMYFSIAKYILA